MKTSSESYITSYNYTITSHQQLTSHIKNCFFLISYLNWACIINVPPSMLLMTAGFTTTPNMCDFFSSLVCVYNKFRIDNKHTSISNRIKMLLLPWTRIDCAPFGKWLRGRRCVGWSLRQSWRKSPCARRLLPQSRKSGRIGPVDKYGGYTNKYTKPRQSAHFKTRRMYCTAPCTHSRPFPISCCNCHCHCHCLWLIRQSPVQSREKW